MEPCVIDVIDSQGYVELNFDHQPSAAAAAEQFVVERDVVVRLQLFPAVAAIFVGGPPHSYCVSLLHWPR
eukprot:SAG11_NODE_59_length_19156_cov_11.188750_2_plen_70_part_00